MKQAFSNKWKASTQPRKQRKYVHNAPLHTRQKFLASPLTKTLKDKYKRNSISVRKGDKVKVLRGQFKGKRGVVELVKIKETRIGVEGIQQLKKDGAKEHYPIHPSNVQIEELFLDDKKRRAKLEAAQK